MKSISISSLRPALYAFGGRLKLAGVNILAITRETFLGFRDARASEAAASIAYYAFFSLFPLLLLLVVGGSFFLQRAVVQAQLGNWIGEIVPGAVDLINQNIQQVLKRRGTFGFIATASLLWSSSGVFNTVVLNINHAWPNARRRSYVTNRVLALSMAGGLIGLSFIALVMKTLVQVLPEHIPLLGVTGWQNSFVWQFFIAILPPVLTFLILWVLYWWIPNTEVSGRASSIAAFITALIYRLFSFGFSWYLGSGLGRYELVYGSLSTIVVLMFWIYFTSWITLWGAHLTSALSRRDKRTA
ncbi:MAG: YihY/virulence factor BrkB family protein [Anaerolineaceae bacterium]|nr:YihY/virulence factor BrkB family protein [Anaerolineaceae bacterium]